MEINQYGEGKQKVNVIFGWYEKSTSLFSGMIQSAILLGEQTRLFHRKVLLGFPRRAGRVRGINGWRKSVSVIDPMGVTGV